MSKFMRNRLSEKVATRRIAHRMNPLRGDARVGFSPRPLNALICGVECTEIILIVEDHNANFSERSVARCLRDVFVCFLSSRK